MSQISIYFLFFDLPNLQAQCDQCEIWVHADCDKLTNKKLKELAEGSSYSCPECRKHQSLLKKPKIAENTGAGPSSVVVPEHLPVLCCGMEGDYLPKYHE
jgi:uncharacterized protein YlaI